MKKWILSLSMPLMLLASTLHAQKTLNYIPSDVSMVMMANPESMDKKMPLSQVREMEVYDVMLEQMTSSFPEDRREDILRLFTDPETHGLNGMAPSFVFARSDEEASAYAFLFELTDPALFQAFLERQVDGAAGGSLENKSIYQYLPVSEGVAIAWNNEVALVAGAMVNYAYPAEDWGYGEPIPEEDWMEEAPAEEMEENTQDPYKEYEEEAPAEEENLDMELPSDNWMENQQQEQAEKMSAWVSEIMGQTFNKDLAANSWYARAEAGANDLHVWMDYGALMESYGGQFDQYSMIMRQMGLGSMGLSSLSGLGEALYADTYLSMGINFEDGAIDMGLDMFGPEKIMNFWEQSLKVKPNKDLLKYIEGDDLIAFLTVNYNLEGLGEGLPDLIYPELEKDPQYGKMATAALDVLGIFFDEEAIYELFRGDLTFAFTGLQEYEEEVVTYEYDEDFNPIEVRKTVTKQMPKVSMMLSYGKQEDMEKIMRLGRTTKVLKPTGHNAYTVGAPGMEDQIHMLMHDGILFITNDQELVETTIPAGGLPKDRQMNKANRKRLKKHAQVMFWDMQKTLEIVGESEGSMQQITGFLGPDALAFKELIVTTPKKVKDSVQSEIQLRMQDEETNALKQIFDMINDLFLASMGGSKT